MHATELKSLSEMPIFKDVALSKLKLIAIAGAREEHPAGDVIAQMGQPSLSVFIVLKGEIEIVKVADGVPVPMARFGSGYIIGDIAVLVGEPHPATFLAVTPVVVLRLDGSVFMQLVTDVPQLSMALMRDMGRRLLKLSKLYADVQV